MADILHRLRLSAPPADVFRALADDDFLRSFWDAVQVVPIDTTLGERLAWRCIDGPAEWVGTEIAFELQPCPGGTLVRFSHRRWRAPTDVMAECATTWARVLLRLAAWVETPEPEDVAVGM